jgi:SAM-dependent methyltransferase
MTSSSVLPRAARRPWEGVWQIVRYNWPFYALSSLSLMLGSGLLFLPWPPWVQNCLMIGIAVAGYWWIASLVVSFWVYDCSELYRWTWLDNLNIAPQRWVNLTAGLDESTPALLAKFPGTFEIMDFYDPQTTPEPSIERARSSARPVYPAQQVSAQSLPGDNAAFDGIFLILSAHELRDIEVRQRFFHELERISRPGASLVIVEHVRDLANFLAFGPGFTHFLPAHVWKTEPLSAGFTLRSESRLTPFLHIYHFRAGEQRLA